MRALFEGAVLIDGTGAAPVRGLAVYVDGTQIVAAGHPGDFVGIDRLERIDLQGKYLLPGFVNVHEHLTNKRVRGTRNEKQRQSTEALVALGVRNALLNLKEGVTTVRDLGGRAELNRVLKGSIDGHVFVGPDVTICPRAITVTGGYSSLNSVEVDCELEARKAAAQLIKVGCEWIKCMASIEWERGEGEPLSAVNMDVPLMRAAFERAHHHGKRSAAHAISDEAIRNAAEAGADSIEHGTMMSRETADFLAGRNVWLVPTLSGYLEHCNDWGRGTGVIRHGELLRPHQEAGFRNAVSAGVRIAYGSDTLGNLADEAAAMQRYGATPMDCIIAATRSGAAMLGMQDRIGTIEAGKQADFAILSRNPLDDPSAFSDVHRVVKAGRMFDPAQLPI